MDSGSLIDETVAAFLQTQACLVLSSASESLVPELCLGLACLVSPGRGRIRVAFDKRSAAPLLSVIPSTGLVALVGSQVVTMRTVQVKGSEASVQPLPAVERPIVAESVARMSREFEKIGYPHPYGVTLLDYEPDELVCVRFTPTAVFDQTPGPQAGQPLAPVPGSAA